MKPLTLELVEEKNSFLNHFTLPKVGGFTFLALAIPTFFVLPLLKGYDNQWFFVYFYSVLSLSFISWILMNTKFRFKADYQIIGSLSLFEDQIQIEHTNKKDIYKCSETTIILHYNSVRGRTFHFLWRDYAHSGISEIVLNDQKYNILVSNENQLDQLKKILAYWYQNNYSISEFMRTPEQNRLKELELVK